LWGPQQALWLANDAPNPETLQQQADAFVAAIDRFVLSIERQLAAYTAILNLFQFVMMVLAIGGAVVMLYTGYLYVINPLDRLRHGLDRLEAGEFGTRIEVDTEDEFGQVASGFNRMAATLQSLYQGLEAKVQAKTERIEAQRARLEALYEVSAFLAKANTMEELSRGFAQRVRNFMRADAVVVRWADEAHQRYLMLASECFAADVRDEEHSLLVGACACGKLDPQARVRVIPIQHEDVAPLRHCARAGYQHLVSVPVRLQQRVLGEVNLFFREEVSLSDDEADLLDALASHLASALEGLRAAALEREAVLGEERTLLARELHDSIAQSLSFLKIQAQLLRAAIQGQRCAQVEQLLDELDRGLRESIHDVRELLVHFRTRTNSDDIEVALRETLNKFHHQTGLPTHFEVEGAGLPLPVDVQVQVLHVIQEALSNVRKHANASRVCLSVHKGTQWRLWVQDDGRGFDVTRANDETHVGIKIMRERAQRIGARVDLESQPGVGTTVRLTLPPYPAMTAQTLTPRQALAS
jgi:two-component system nitrate/nitrite sensor histidine kinase NarX